MPLETVGKAKIHRTGKSVLIEYDPRGSVFTHKLFINREGLRRVLDDKQASVNVVTPVHKSRVQKKFDL